MLGMDHWKVKLVWPAGRGCGVYAAWISVNRKNLVTEKGQKGAYWNCHDGVSNKKLIVPMEHQAAWKVATGYDSGDSWKDGLIAFADEFDLEDFWCFAANPFSVKIGEKY